MTNTQKNIFYFILLVVLCFLIKQKLDSNSKEAAFENKTQIDTEIIERSTTSSIKVSESPPASVPEKAKSNPSSHTNPITQNIPKKNPEEVAALPLEKKVKTKIKGKPKPVVKREAKIEYETLNWDFGEIIEGDIVTKKFKFKNVGNAPLQILTADADCGCARPTVPFLDIAPGEYNEIGVTYNSVNKNGPQTPEIIIESNTVPKFHVLKMTVLVKPKEKKQTADSFPMQTDSLKN